MDKLTKRLSSIWSEGLVCGLTTALVLLDNNVLASKIFFGSRSLISSFLHCSSCKRPFVIMSQYRFTQLLSFARSHATLDVLCMHREPTYVDNVFCIFRQSWLAVTPENSGRNVSCRVRLHDR